MNRPLRVFHYADLETVYDAPEHVGRLAGCIDAIRDKTMMVVGAGDNTALGSLALVTDEGRAQVRPFFEAVRPDAETFGNHDFDHGADSAIEFTDRTPQEWLCANVQGLDSVAPSTCFEVGSYQVGVVGVAHPQTAEMCGVNATFTDPVAAANRESRVLREHVDYVILPRAPRRRPRFLGDGRRRYSALRTRNDSTGSSHRWNATRANCR